MTDTKSLHLLFAGRNTHDTRLEVQWQGRGFAPRRFGRFVFRVHRLWGRFCTTFLHTEQSVNPWLLLTHGTPLLEGEFVSHWKVASWTNRFQVWNICASSTRLWNIMTTLEIKYSNLIATPGCLTFGFKSFSNFRNPNLFTQSFRYLLLFVLHYRLKTDSV